MTTPSNINTLRDQLMATLADLRNRDNPMEPDRARVIALVAGVVVDTARVENDYLKITQGQGAAFFEALESDGIPAIASSQGAHNPFPVITSHRIKG